MNTKIYICLYNLVVKINFARNSCDINYKKNDFYEIKNKVLKIVIYVSICTSITMK